VKINEFTEQISVIFHTMGIAKLMGLLTEKCPKAIKETNMDMFSGKTLACDASMTIYHFIIAT